MNSDADDAAPLIVTLAFDPPTQRFFDAQRRAHFPPARNHLDAHLTLFHALPAGRIDEVIHVLEAEAQATSTLALHVSGLRSLGRGVAYVVDSAALSTLRARIAQAFRDDLTPQDAQPLRAHVTVQNKVAPDAAKRLLDQLRASFQPFDGRGEALALWRYRGGPWEAVDRFAFTGTAT